MPYIAQKRLKVGHDEESDTPIYREVGDEVPEAETWPWQTRDTYRREGHIREVTDTAVPVPARRPVKGKTHG